MLSLLALRSLAAALAGPCLGFVRPIWAISVGYGVAMAGQALLALLSGSASASSGPDRLAQAHAALVAAYGVRLAVFLVCGGKGGGGSNNSGLSAMRAGENKQGREGAHSCAAVLALGDTPVRPLRRSYGATTLSNLSSGAGLRSMRR